MYSEYTTIVNGKPKCWHHRWFRAICFSLIALAILAVALSLLLKFVIFTPDQSESAIITAPSSTPTTTTQQRGKP